MKKIEKNPRLHVLEIHFFFSVLSFIALGCSAPVCLYEYSTASTDSCSVFMKCCCLFSYVIFFFLFNSGLTDWVLVWFSNAEFDIHNYGLIFYCAIYSTFFFRIVFNWFVFFFFFLLACDQARTSICIYFRIYKSCFFFAFLLLFSTLSLFVGVFIHCWFALDIEIIFNFIEREKKKFITET